MRAIVALAVGVALIALAAVVFLAPRPSTQVVPLEPISATPQQSGSGANPPASSAAASPVAPAPAVKPAEKLTPRPVTPSTTPPAASTEPSENPPDTDSVTPPEPPAPDASPSSATPETTPPASPASQPSSLPVRQTAQGWGVQAGAYKTEANATAMRDRLLKAGLAARVEPNSDGIYRVLVGAYATSDEARAASPTILAALK